jgi:four helix bundle protein
MFPYEKWTVYRLALELREIAIELSAVRVRGAANDQRHLSESASSILFNLGEGALRRKKGEKIQFYQMALGSTGEYYAALTVLSRIHPNRKLIAHGAEVSNHVAALITNLIKSVEENY